jgi:hypothetical protein
VAAALERHHYHPELPPDVASRAAAAAGLLVQFLPMRQAALGLVLRMAIFPPALLQAVLRAAIVASVAHPLVSASAQLHQAPVV